ncbi:MAG TPA: DUF3500 domain-containing protein [Vicinamibacterales bacterium]|jgi:hypothetical protein|nr:DUF3500 domain-containing protein [Vicinamibacterales bacterium]
MHMSRSTTATRFWLAAACAAACAAGAGVSAERSSSAMASAATKFLASLTPEERRQAAFPFDGDERLHWHFIPTEMFPREGLTIKDMTAPQRRLAHDLLKAGLSQRGYLTATSIMDLETVLGALEARERAAAPAPPRGAPLVRDPERYFFSVFGTPTAAPSKDAWGWRVEGHHVSLHFTIVNGSMVASSPSFFGANPAEVREGPKKGLRILGAEEDAARALLMALDPAQREKAIIEKTAPNDMVTMANVNIKPLAPAGLTAEGMTATQRDLLMKLVDVYAGFMTPEVAADRQTRLKQAGIEKIGFAWAGEIEKGKKHYYRIQGPTFLVEYDNTQNDGNHIHSVWRDFNGDFGRDLLREHLKSTPH